MEAKKREEAEKHRNRAVFPLHGPPAARSQPTQGILHCKEKFLSKVPDSLFWQISAEPDFRYTNFFEPTHTGPRTNDHGPGTQEQQLGTLIVYRFPRPPSSVSSSVS